MDLHFGVGLATAEDLAVDVDANCYNYWCSRRPDYNNLAMATQYFFRLRNRTFSY